MFDAYVAVTGGKDMWQFWKSSPKELLAWLAAIAKRAEKGEKINELLTEGEY